MSLGLVSWTVFAFCRFASFGLSAGQNCCSLHVGNRGGGFGRGFFQKVYRRRCWGMHVFSCAEREAPGEGTYTTKRVFGACVCGSGLRNSLAEECCRSGLGDD